MEHPVVLLLIMSVCCANIESRPQGKSTASRIEEWREGMNFNPEELGDLFQGDLDINVPQPDISQTADEAKLENIALDIPINRWSKGEIPYVINGAFTQVERENITSAMKEIENHTCIKFLKARNTQDYLSITRDNKGCSTSAVGYHSGITTLNLQRGGCTHKGIIMHELLHAIGLYHEQSRPDRNRYIKIVWDHIKEGARPNFYNVSSVNSYGVGYSPDSIMHYSRNAFSIDQKHKPTFIVSDPTHVNAFLNVGQRKALGTSDILRVKYMYNCRQGNAHTDIAAGTYKEK